MPASKTVIVAVVVVVVDVLVVGIGIVVVIVLALEASSSLVPASKNFHHDLCHFHSYDQLFCLI